MQTKYSEVYAYWNNNPCSGGNKSFPFKIFKNSKVLEIGCGCGVDAKRFVDAGAIYTGIDLTDNAVYQTKFKIGDKGKVLKMNAEYLDFSDESFDCVYSFGVIHHAVSPENIIKEAYRVIKKGGFLYVMLYNKYSVRYYLDIMFLRKILWFLRFPKYNKLRKECPNPTKEQWLSWNTDTLGCPIARVYSPKDIEKLLDCGFKKLIIDQPFVYWFGKVWAIK